MEKVKNEIEEIETSVEKNLEFLEGFSWRMAFTGFFPYVAAKKWWKVVLFIVTQVFAGIAQIFWFIYIGFKGKKIIYSGKNFANEDEKIGAIKSVQNLGAFYIFMFLFSVIVAAIVLGVIITVAIMQGNFSIDGGINAINQGIEGTLNVVNNVK